MHALARRGLWPGGRTGLHWPAAAPYLCVRELKGTRALAIFGLRQWKALLPRYHAKNSAPPPHTPFFPTEASTSDWLRFKEVEGYVEEAQKRNGTGELATPAADITSPLPSTEADSTLSTPTPFEGREQQGGLEAFIAQQNVLQHGGASVHVQAQAEHTDPVQAQAWAHFLSQHSALHTADQGTPWTPLGDQPANQAEANETGADEQQAPISSEDREVQERLIGYLKDQAYQKGLGGGGGEQGHVDVDRGQAVAMGRLPTPREIVSDLDSHVVGQQDAKRALAIALRNRWRCSHLPAPQRDLLSPSHILMIGPRGTGKTEILHRLAQTTGIKFVKVEASQFLDSREVPYLLELLVARATDDALQALRASVNEVVRRGLEASLLQAVGLGASPDTDPAKQRFCHDLWAGRLDGLEIELDPRPQGSSNNLRLSGFDELADAADGEHLAAIYRTLKASTEEEIARMQQASPWQGARVHVGDVLALLRLVEADRLLDRHTVCAEACRQVQRSGVVLLEDVDCLCNPDYNPRAESVQRGLVEMMRGQQYTTRYGPVNTKQILFIAAGRFNCYEPSALIPELQARLSLRVQLKPLAPHDYYNLLTGPGTGLLQQQVALFATENIKLEFTKDAIEEMARIAHEINSVVHNIGARRLYTVIERILQELSFNAPEHGAQGLRGPQRVVIDGAQVRAKVGDQFMKTDLSRFML